MTIQYKGCHLGGDLYKTGAGKIRNEHTLPFMYKFIIMNNSNSNNNNNNNREKNKCSYKYVCNILASAGILVNSEGEFTID